MNKQVTVPAAAVTLILTPAGRMGSGYIQNASGGNDCLLAFDGGVAAGGTATDPSATVGFLLPAGGLVFLAQLYGSNIAGLPAARPPIKAYSTSGTTLNVGTDDIAST